MRADEGTLQQVRVVLASAMERGADPAEALDKAGLLMFNARTVHLQRAALRRLADVLDEIGVDQLAAVVESRMPLTALDTKRLIVKWINVTAEGML